MENIQEHCEEEGLNDNESDRLDPGHTETKTSTHSSSSVLSSTTSGAVINCSSSTGSWDPSDEFSRSKPSRSLDTQLESSSSRFSPIIPATQSTTVRRSPHLHKLEKKHSSGDLHSRLKTRKLLGVGETDDGDIHRSKLSQILGHSDQLYIKLPYGLRIWQFIMAAMFTVTGVWALILPSQIFYTTFDIEADSNVSLPLRLYGGAIISLSIIYWMTLYSQDRDVIRMCLLSSIVYFAIQFIVTSCHWLLSSQSFPRNPVLVSFSGVLILVNSFFPWALIQRKSSSFQHSTSDKDLNKD